VLLTKDECSNHSELLDVLRALKVLEHFHKNAFTEWMLTPNSYLAGIEISEGHSNHLPVHAKLSCFRFLLQLDAVCEADLFHSGVKQWVVSCDRWRWLEQMLEGVDKNLESVAVLSK